MSARTEALRALVSVLARRRRVEEAVAGVRLQGADRRLVHELVYGTLRHWHRLLSDWRRFARKKPPVPAAAALAMGAYQLRVMGTPPHAAVHETVAAVKALAPKLAGFVNAVLRRLVASEPRFGHALPDWVRTRWTRAFGKARTDAIAEALLATPPITLRIRGDRDAWLAKAQAEGISAKPAGTQAVLLTPPVEIAALPGYAEGAFWVMDLAAQEIAEALPIPEDARVVVDLCAAPGGKTALLALRAPAACIVAVERDAARMRRLRENLARLRLSAACMLADAAKAPLAENAADAVLVDAPCSASGVARRRPDVWFRHGPRDLAGFAREQRALLSEALRIARPGGWVLYAVCSLHPEEGEGVVEGMPGLVRTWRIWPDAAHDGFFAALLRKP